jgi:hypothetical protein
MSITAIERLEVIIGQVHMVEKANAHLSGISVRTSPDGEVSLFLKATKKPADLVIQAAWYTIIDNLPDTSKFHSIDAIASGDSVGVTYNLTTPPGIVRLALYYAY